MNGLSSAMPSLFDEILGVARDYMGIAAEEYVRRRLRIVLKGNAPEMVARENLDRLAAGIGMTAKVYMSEQKAAAFKDAVLALKQSWP